MTVVDLRLLLSKTAPKLSSPSPARTRCKWATGHPGMYRCLAYNKWGRPNPPYVFFKYDGNAWQRIPLSEFPAEFKNINLVINTLAHEMEISSQSPVRAELVKKLNSSLEQPEFKTILREPVKSGIGITSCEELIHYKCGWISPHGTFGRDFMDNTCK